MAEWGSVLREQVELPGPVKSRPRKSAFKAWLLQLAHRPDGLGLIRHLLQAAIGVINLKGEEAGLRCVLFTDWESSDHSAQTLVKSLLYRHFQRFGLEYTHTSSYYPTTLVSESIFQVGYILFTLCVYSTLDLQ